MNSIVVHYKELALKGRNRPWFIQQLVRNIKTALTGLRVTSVRALVGRIEIELAPLANGDLKESSRAWDEVRTRLGRVFGIANFSYAGRAPHNFEALAAAILADVGTLHPASFRVRARRADKRLPFSSPQVEREVGGLIKKATGWNVDLDAGELTIHLELLADHA